MVARQFANIENYILIFMVICHIIYLSIFFDRARSLYGDFTGGCATHYYPNCCRDWRWLHEEIHIENFVFDIDIFNCFYDKCKITAPSVKM